VASSRWLSGKVTWQRRPGVGRIRPALGFDRPHPQIDFAGGLWVDV